MSQDVRPERDPRRDPQPMDNFRKGDAAREVVWIGPAGEIVYDDSKGRQQVLCDLKTWRQWAKSATIVETNRFIDNLVDENFKVTHTLMWQINRLANRFATVSQDVGTPYSS